MKKSPYVILSTAVTLDGYIDKAGDERLIISNKADFDRVDALRATCDAILVGANTINKDDPRLLIRSKQRQIERLKKGLSENPVKITITSTGKINKDSLFFTAGDNEKIVYTTEEQAEKLRKQLLHATIVEAGTGSVTLTSVLQDLYLKGIRRLLVEGGSSIITQFFQEGLVDEAQIAIAGFFVGDANAPRFVKPGIFPQNETNRMRLKTVKQIDDIAVLIYKV